MGKEQVRALKRKFTQSIQDWYLNDADHPLLVTGARRTGKAFVIEHSCDAIAGDQFVKLDFQADLESVERIFDGPTDEVDRIVTRISEYTGKVLDPERAILFFDGVQLCEKALNSLRFFAGTAWRVIASGSLLGVTTKQRRLPFPSGVRQLTLHPLDRYLVVGGMPLPVRRYRDTGIIESALEEIAEIDATYTADMTDPDNGISGISAKRIWDSLPKQLLRASTKKFKYADVVRGGRRERLLEPLEWLAAAGIVSINDLTRCTQPPLSAYSADKGSFFKVYVADTGVMFNKFGIDPKFVLDSSLQGVLSSDFRGALAENYVMQALRAAGLKTYYWMPEGSGARGEIDFVFQTREAQVIPVEVKSARNVSAKSLSRFMTEGRAPYGIRLSEKDFGRAELENGCELRSLPLYAAHCVGE